jgi:hypothetical protein
MVWTTASVWPAYASGGASRRPGGISRLRERNSSARAVMNGDAAGLGDAFARGACGFLRAGPAGAVEALPPAPLPNELADLLGGLIAP